MSLKDRNRVGNLGQPAPIKPDAGAVQPPRRSAVPPNECAEGISRMVSVTMHPQDEELARAAYVTDYHAGKARTYRAWIAEAVEDFLAMTARQRRTAAVVAPATRGRGRPFGVRVEDDQLDRIAQVRQSEGGRSTSAWIAQAIRVRTHFVVGEHGGRLPPAPETLPRA